MPLNGIGVGAFSIALIHRPRVPQLFAATLLALSAGGCSGQAALLSPTSPGVDASAQEVVASRPPSTLAASASEHRGCPALGNPGGNSGMRFIGLMAVEEAVALSVAQITDAWYAEFGFVKEDYIAERLAGVATLDKNGDGLLCVGQVWGADLNPHSHWAEVYADLLSPPATERWAFADNHNGTSNKR